MPNRKSLLDYNLAGIFKSLGNPTRLLIVTTLFNHPKRSMTVSQIKDTLILPQSLVSQSLSRLKSSNVVSSERIGINMYYTLDNQEVMTILRTLEI